MKYLEDFYKYKDLVGQGAEHKAYYIDDDWILKMPRKSDYTSNKDRLVNFNNHIRIMNKYPNIFVKVKKLDRYRASVEKVNIEKATEEIKYFYKYIFDILNNNEELGNKYWDMIVKNGYVEIIFKFTYSFTNFLKELLFIVNDYALKDNESIVIKWCEFIKKIINSKVEFETDYFDSKSWNFGLDNEGNIKMIDF